MRDGSRWRLDEVAFEGEECQHSKEKKRAGIRRRDHSLREMGNLIAKEEPPPMVLVPPIFDFPPIAARTRMLVPAYDLMFGKLALHCLFEDYFEKANRLNALIMLKPLEDPNVDLIATVTDSLDKTSGGSMEGQALFRWQRDLDNPNTFIDLLVSTNDPTLRLRVSSYISKYQIGAFGVFPLLKRERLLPEDYGFMGMRYGSERLSIGSTFMPFPLSSETPFNTWLIGRAGRFSAGVLFKSVCENKRVCFKDLNNWSCAIGYDVGSRSPLCPSYNFSLELARNSQLIASFYQHLVVQRRVKNPFEESEIVGITNYIDFGFELRTRINEVKSSSIGDSSSFQLAASWQANKNFLLKGKLGPLTSSVALAFKSWWRPSFTFSITANNDHSRGTTSYGFGIRVEDLREPSYQRADPNYVMLTPNMEHLATGVLQNFGKMPLFQSNIDSGNYDHLPRELKPIGKIF